MPAASNPAEQPPGKRGGPIGGGGFEQKYQEIKFGRIKKSDKVKFCPFEKMISHEINPQSPSSPLQGLGNHLPWAPEKSMEFLIQKNTEKSGENKRTKTTTTTAQLPTKQAYLSPSANTSNTTTTHTTHTASNATSATSATKAAPSSWSALLKTQSQQQSEATQSSQQSSNQSTPSLPKKKKSAPQPSGTNPPPKHTPHIEKWRVVNTSQRGPPIVPRGLVNSGNTCFMNSILHPLLHTPPVYLFLMGLNQRGGIYPPLNVKTPILDSMMTFVKEFRNSTSDPLNQDPILDCAFSCDYVYDAIRLNYARTALKGRQEDASEYLTWILDGMHEELLKTIDRPRVEAESGVEWTLVEKKNKQISTQSHEVNPTQITRIFQGVWKSTLRVGAKESVTTEPFTILHVEASYDSVEDALLSGSVPESLEQGDSPVVPTKQVQIEKLPPVLFISIKRFKLDMDGKALKVTKHIEVPMKLEIPSECLSSTMVFPSSPHEKRARSYQLYAVVQHHGKTMEGGHYTCDVLHQTGQWLRFDDSTVTQIDASLVATQHKDYQPYLLFYIETK